MFDITEPRATLDIDVDLNCRAVATNKFAKVLDSRALK
jgi:hypothetical protein